MTKTIVLPVAEYAPDLPVGAGSEQTIWNVVPRTRESYGPVASPQAFYDALPSRVHGGAAYRADDGAVSIFVGTETDLYLMRAGHGTWQGVSQVDGGYSAGTESWQFVYFNGTAIAANIGNPLQKFALSVDSRFSDLSSAAPRAKYIAVVKNNFIVLGNTYDASNGAKQQRIWWSGAGDSTSWPALGTNLAAEVQSGAVDLLGPGGCVQGIAAGLSAADAVIFQEYAVRRMMYSGPPSIFDFQPCEMARGLMCPDSLVVNGGISYYWGHDGICAFNGAESLSIGANKIDRTVYRDLNNAHIDRVVGASDPINKLIWWAYPSGSSIGGTPDRLLIYNWDLDRFALAAVTCETILKLLSIGYTLDELFTILGYTIDALPAPLDDPIWTGGRLTLGIFDSNHQANFLVGTPLEATVETAELPAPPGGRWLVTDSRPMVDGVGTIPSVTIGRRERMQDAVAYTDPVALNAMGKCPARTSGRYLRGKTIVPAGSNAWAHISGIELNLTPQGRR